MIIKEFLPGLIDSIHADLHRFKLRDVINMMMSFQSMYDKVANVTDLQIMTAAQFRNLHSMTHVYLSEYISKYKKEINGSDYANLIEILYRA